MARALSLLFAGLALGGCKTDRATQTPEPTPGSTTQTVSEAEVEPGEHLLYSPEGDASGLLGREVTRDADGHYVIASERRPGCRAEPTTVANGYHRDYRSELRDAAGVAASVRRIAELSAHYEGRLFLRLSVDNVHVLRADLTGDCGEQVITEVKVGTGSREIVHARGGGGEVTIDLGPAGGGTAGGERERSEQETLQWGEPQAWAFKLSAGNKGANDIRIVMPEILTAGTRFTARVEVAKALWLVVLYRDAAGHHGVLLPRGKHEVLAEGASLALPDMIPSNVEGHAEDRETLLVYGFTEEADYHQLKPPAGAISTEQTDAYAAELAARLDRGEIPRARWTSTEFTYLIRPAE